MEPAPDEMAVAVLIAALHNQARLLAGHEAAEVSLVGEKVGLVHEASRGFVKELLARTAQGGAECVVHQPVDAFRADQRHPDAGAFERTRELFGALP